MTRQATWLRRGGLALATLGSAFWLFAVIVGVVGAGAPWSVEAVLLLLLVAFGALASIVAWQWQRAGSLLLLAAGLCLAVFATVVAGRNRALIAMLLGGPFLLAGALLQHSMAVMDRIGSGSPLQASSGEVHVKRD